MTRSQILEHQLKKNLTEDDYSAVTEDDKSFVLAKATAIVDDYVNYSSTGELDYIICDMALDMLQDELVAKANTKPMDVPSNVASIKEGDTIITFNTDKTLDVSKSGTANRGPSDAYYLDTYRDRLNRHRKMRR